MKKMGASWFEQSKKEFGKVDFEGVSHDTDAHALAPAAARARRGSCSPYNDRKHFMIQL